MPQHDIIIDIGKNGEVTVRIKGAKGKQCLAYGDMVARIVGKIKSQQRTSEYYEPPTKAKIDLEQKQGT